MSDLDIILARLGEQDDRLDRLEQLLAAGPTVERLLTKTELADLLGVSTRQIDHLRADGMPTYRVGSSPRWRGSEAIAWLRERDQRDGGGAELRVIEGGGE